MLHCSFDIVNKMIAIPTAILEESVCPIVSCSRDIIDEGLLVEYLADVTFEELIGDSFFHVHHHCPCLQLSDRTA